MTDDSLKRKGLLHTPKQALDLCSSLLTLMYIDLERDSAIRVRALMALAAYSVRQLMQASLLSLNRNLEL